MNSGRNALTKFFHVTFLSNLMCPLRARISVPMRRALFNGVPATRFENESRQP